MSVPNAGAHVGDALAHRVGLDGRRPVDHDVLRRRRGRSARVRLRQGLHGRRHPLHVVLCVLHAVRRRHARPRVGAEPHPAHRRLGAGRCGVVSAHRPLLGGARELVGGDQGVPGQQGGRRRRCSSVPSSSASSVGSFRFTDIMDGGRRRRWRRCAQPSSPSGPGLALFIGAMGKSAQFPLHVWLPDAMAGPTPVSALMHAATMVTAGVYLHRPDVPVLQLRGFADEMRWIIIIIGALTLFLTGLIALVQDDIKKVLAYSTLSQLGYMVVAMGAGAYTAGLFHLFTHAFFKALLFLGAGSVIHSVHSNNMSDMGGLAQVHAADVLDVHDRFGWRSPASSRSPGSGRRTKSWRRSNTPVRTTPRLRAGRRSPTFVLCVAIVGAFVTAFYMTRAVSLTFFGEYKGHGASARVAEDDDLPADRSRVRSRSSRVSSTSPGVTEFFTEGVGARIRRRRSTTTPRRSTIVLALARDTGRGRLGIVARLPPVVRRRGDPGGAGHVPHPGAVPAAREQVLHRRLLHGRHHPADPRSDCRGDRLVQRSRDRLRRQRGRASSPSGVGKYVYAFDQRGTRRGDQRLGAVHAAASGAFLRDVPDRPGPAVRRHDRCGGRCSSSAGFTSSDAGGNSRWVGSRTDGG